MNKPRYRVTSAPVSTNENKLILHAVNHAWYLCIDTKLTIFWDAYSIGIGVRIQ